MSTFGKIVRYIFAIIFILILIPVIFVGLPATATSQTFVDRDNVKEILSNPDIYDGLLNAIVSSAQTMQESSSSTDGTDSLALMLSDDNSFSKDLKAIVTSDETKQKVNTIIDAFYDWFEGKTPSPVFEVYLIEDDQVFKNMFTSMMLAQINSLPLCDSYENIPTDITEMECVPRYLDEDEVAPLIEESMPTDSASLQELKDSFKFSSDQLNISESTSLMVQNTYTVLKLLPYILAGTVLLLTLLIVLLIPGVKGGLITTSIIYILNGTLFLILSVVSKAGTLVNNVYSLSQVDFDLSYAQMQAVMVSFITPLFAKIFEYLKTYSLVVLGLGIILLILGIVLKKKDKKVEEPAPVQAKEETETK